MLFVFGFTFFLRNVFISGFTLLVVLSVAFLFRDIFVATSKSNFSTLTMKDLSVSLRGFTLRFISGLTSLFVAGLALILVCSFVNGFVSLTALLFVLSGAFLLVFGFVNSLTLVFIFGLAFLFISSLVF